jgi:predicted nucleic acid-binding protein
VRARYLADKSALARFRIRAVADRLGPLLEDGEIATCAIIDLEVLYSSRSLRDYEDVLEERAAIEDAPITPEVMAGAITLQHALARRGQHRVPLPDLIISATANRFGLTVLHYDADFERLATAGGAPHEWVAPKGSL